MPVDHYENFPVASLLLPPSIRHAVREIYRFARSADDIADEGDLGTDERLAGLRRFHDVLDQVESDGHAIAPEYAGLATAVREFHLPVPLLRDLLRAFEQDVHTRRYADWTSLLDYCRLSANPVGRLMLHLVDAADDDACAASDAICSALQLANFWQDVALDWQKGRVYLPQEDLRRFGIDEGQIAAGRWTAQWAALMDFEVERTRNLMLAGTPLLARLSGRMRWEVRATVNGGLRILNRLQRVRGDAFARRPTLVTRDWLWIAARTIAGVPRARRPAAAATGRPGVLR
jgi:squalene synthase HpnC